ncbi:Proteins of 100 residues with WXG OS=Streptomyces microflavus OX=1919 GN=Smic_21040 PE=4 SV=1 [Streptomyces microflavus]
MDSADLNVSAATLAQIAKGIYLAHTELKDLTSLGKASAGRGFSDLALSGLEFGHGGLTSASAAG